MNSERLTSKFWISAYIKRLESQGIPVFIVKKGDQVAGAILIVISNLKGFSTIFTQSFDAEGNRIWLELTRGSDIEIAETIKKQKDIDPDIWILEVENPKGKNVINER